MSCSKERPRAADTGKRALSACACPVHRHLGSSGVDVYSAVAGGVGALYGPLHGGANEAVLKMLERIGTVDKIPAFVEGVKNRKEKMFGFGHRWGDGRAVPYATLPSVTDAEPRKRLDAGAMLNEACSQMHS